MLQFKSHKSIGSKLNQGNPINYMRKTIEQQKQTRTYIETEYLITTVILLTSTGHCRPIFLAVLI